MNKRLYQNHFARKRFGQNFLNDQHIIENIVAAIHPESGQALVEIGPGLAALTLPIAQQIDKLTVIEIDRDLAARLILHPQLTGKITVIEQDAMTVDFNQLAKEKGQKLRVFGNLPYNISTPLMFHLFSAIDAIADMYFMLQKEVVNRLTAAPNSKAYGKLTVMAQYFCQIIPVLAVPPTAFTPSPKVDSAIVRLIPHSRPACSVNNIKLLHSVTTEAFNQRRKTLRNSLSRFITAQQLTALNIDPTSRAENLSVSDYCRIVNHLTANDISSLIQLD